MGKREVEVGGDEAMRWLRKASKKREKAKRRRKLRNLEDIDCIRACTYLSNMF